MNRYITLLLVLIAATGSEAQAIESAIAVSKGGCVIEEILTPEQMHAISSDIMSVLKGFQLKADNGNNIHFYYNNLLFNAVCGRGYSSHGLSSRHVWGKALGRQRLFAESAISIRAPSDR